MSSNITSEELQGTNMQEIYEAVVHNLDLTPDTACIRQCRAMYVPNDIEHTPRGKSQVLMVEGGGLGTEWIFYHSLDGRLFLIFRSLFGYGNTFSYSGKEIDEYPTSFSPYDNCFGEIPDDLTTSA